MQDDTKQQLNQSDQEGDLTTDDLFRMADQMETAAEQTKEMAQDFVEMIKGINEAVPGENNSSVSALGTSSGTSLIDADKVTLSTPQSLQELATANEPSLQPIQENTAEQNIQLSSLPSMSDVPEVLPVVPELAPTLSMPEKTPAENPAQPPMLAEQLAPQVAPVAENTATN